MVDLKKKVFVFLVVLSILLFPVFTNAQVVDGWNVFQISDSSLEYTKSSHSNIYIQNDSSKTISKIVIDDQALSSSYYNVNNDEIEIDANWLDENLVLGSYEIKIYYDSDKDNKSIGCINLEVMDVPNPDIIVDGNEPRPFTLFDEIYYYKNAPINNLTRSVALPSSDSYIVSVKINGNEFNDYSLQGEVFSFYGFDAFDLGEYELEILIHESMENVDYISKSKLIVEDDYPKTEYQLLDDIVYHKEYQGPTTYYYNMPTDNTEVLSVLIGDQTVDEFNNNSLTLSKSLLNGLDIGDYTLEVIMYDNIDKTYYVSRTNVSILDEVPPTEFQMIDDFDFHDNYEGDIVVEYVLPTSTTEITDVYILVNNFPYSTEYYSNGTITFINSLLDGLDLGQYQVIIRAYDRETYTYYISKTFVNILEELPPTEYRMMDDIVYYKNSPVPTFECTFPTKTSYITDVIIRDRDNYFWSVNYSENRINFIDSFINSLDVGHYTLVVSVYDSENLIKYISYSDVEILDEVQNKPATYNLLSDIEYHKYYEGPMSYGYTLPTTNTEVLNVLIGEYTINSYDNDSLTLDNDLLNKLDIGDYVLEINMYDNTTYTYYVSRTKVTILEELEPTSYSLLSDIEYHKYYEGPMDYYYTLPTTNTEVLNVLIGEYTINSFDNDSLTLDKDILNLFDIGDYVLEINMYDNTTYTYYVSRTKVTILEELEPTSYNLLSDIEYHKYYEGPMDYYYTLPTTNTEVLNVLIGEYTINSFDNDSLTLDKDILNLFDIGDYVLEINMYDNTTYTYYVSRTKVTILKELEPTSYNLLSDIEYHKYYEGPMDYYYTLPTTNTEVLNVLIGEYTINSFDNDSLTLDKDILNLFDIGDYVLEINMYDNNTYTYYVSRTKVTILEELEPTICDLLDDVIYHRGYQESMSFDYKMPTSNTEVLNVLLGDEVINLFDNYVLRIDKDLLNSLELGDYVLEINLYDRNTYTYYVSKSNVSIKGVVNETVSWNALNNFSYYKNQYPYKRLAFYFDMPNNSSTTESVLLGEHNVDFVDGVVIFDVDYLELLDYGAYILRILAYDESSNTYYLSTSKVFIPVGEEPTSFNIIEDFDYVKNTESVILDCTLPTNNTTVENIYLMDEYTAYVAGVYKNNKIYFDNTVLNHLDEGQYEIRIVGFDDTTNIMYGSKTYVNIIDSDINYEIIISNDGIFDKYSDDNFILEVNPDLEYFNTIFNDGVEFTNYQMEDNKIVINRDYLTSLTLGSHNFKLVINGYEYNVSYEVINSIKGILNLHVLDEDNKAQENITYSLLNNNKEVIGELITDNNGYASIDNLELGTYYLSYKSGAAYGVSSYYKNPNNMIEINITEDNNIVNTEIIFTYDRVDMDVYVLDTNLENGLGDVWLVITDINNNEITKIVTNNNGYSVIKNLINGGKYKYYVYSVPLEYEVWKVNEDVNIDYFLANSESEIILYWRKVDNTEITVEDLEQIITGDYEVSLLEDSVNTYLDDESTLVSIELYNLIKEKLLNNGIDLDLLDFELEIEEGVYDYRDKTYNIYVGYVYIYNSDDIYLGATRINISYKNTNNHTNEEELEYKEFVDNNSFDFIYDGYCGDPFYVMYEEINKLITNNSMKIKLLDLRAGSSGYKIEWPYLVFINNNYYGLVNASLTSIIKVIIPYEVEDDNQYLLEYLKGYLLEQQIIMDEDEIYIDSDSIYLNNSDEKIGIYTSIKEDKTRYQLELDNYEYDLLSNNNLNIIMNPIGEVLNVLIDNNTVIYQVNNNNIEISSDSLNNLEEGKHTIKVVFKKGEEEIEFNCIKIEEDIISKLDRIFSNSIYLDLLEVEMYDYDYTNNISILKKEISSKVEELLKENNINLVDGKYYLNYVFTSTPLFDGYNGEIMLFQDNKYIKTYEVNLIYKNTNFHTDEEKEYVDSIINNNTFNFEDIILLEDSVYFASNLNTYIDNISNEYNLKLVRIDNYYSKPYEYLYAVFYNDKYYGRLMVNYKVYRKILIPYGVEDINSYAIEVVKDFYDRNNKYLARDEQLDTSVELEFVDDLLYSVDRRYNLGLFILEREDSYNINIDNRDIYVLNNSIDLEIIRDNNSEILSVLIGDREVNYIINDSNNIVISKDILDGYNRGTYNIKVNTIDGYGESVIRILTIDEYKNELPKSYTVDYHEKDMLDNSEKDKYGKYKRNDTKITNEVARQLRDKLRNDGLTEEVISSVIVLNDIYYMIFPSVDEVLNSILFKKYPIDYLENDSARLDKLFVRILSIDYIEYIPIIFNNSNNYREEDKNYIEEFVSQNDLNYYYEYNLDNNSFTLYNQEEIVSNYNIVIDNLKSILDGTGIEIVSDPTLKYQDSYRTYLFNDYYFYRVYLFKNDKYYKTIRVYYITMPVINIPWYVEDDNNYIMNECGNYIIKYYTNDNINNLVYQDDYIYNKNTNKKYGVIKAVKDNNNKYSALNNKIDYEKESNKNVIYYLDRNIDNIRKLSIGRLDINNRFYLIDDNMLIIKSELLDILNVGEYEIYLETESGSCELFVNVKAKQYYYSIGNNASINIDNSVTIIFKIEADLEKFVTVYINNWEVPREYYTLRRGSTIIDFTENFLNSLQNGYYEIKAIFTDGEAITWFNVSNNSNNNNNVIDDSNSTNIVKDYKVSYSSNNNSNKSNYSSSNNHNSLKNANTSSFGEDSSYRIVNSSKSNTFTKVMVFILLNILLSTGIICYAKKKVI